VAWTLYIADQARSEIMEIWQYGYDTFGLQVADDYDDRGNDCRGCQYFPGNPGTSHRSDQSYRHKPRGERTRHRRF